MVAELRMLRDVELARRCLDLERMQALIDNWPDTLEPKHAPDYTLLLLRGVMMGRFIRWFQQRWG